MIDQLTLHHDLKNCRKKMFDPGQTVILSDFCHPNTFTSVEIMGQTVEPLPVSVASVVYH